MRSVLFWAAALVAGLAMAMPARADDAAKKVLAEAITAHGGAEKLAKYKDKGSVTKGKMKLFMPIEAEGPIEIQSGDKKFRRELQFSFMGTDIKNTVVFDGKAMYVLTVAGANKGMLTTFDKKEDLDALHEAIHSEKALELAMVGGKDVEVSLIGDDKVGDTPVVGIRVAVKDHKDVNLYFDKKTHLLKRVVGRALDFETRMEVEQERIMEEYKEIDGMMRAVRATVLKDGKKQVEIEITETKYVDKFDDDTFAKPKE